MVSSEERQDTSCFKVGAIGCGGLLAFIFIGPILSLLLFVGPNLLLTGVGNLFTGEAWVGSLLCGLVMTTVEGVVLWKGGQFAWSKLMGGSYSQLRVWLHEQGVQFEDDPGSRTTEQTV